MPALENPRREAYAQGLAKGTPKTQAYVDGDRTGLGPAGGQARS
jgi:hypothetical protein